MRSKSKVPIQVHTSYRILTSSPLTPNTLFFLPPPPPQIAMKSGMLAAEAIYPLLTTRGAETAVALTGSVDNCKTSTDEPTSLTVGTGIGKGEAVAIEPVLYEQALQSSWIAEELKEIRNTHAAFHYGLLAGMVHTGTSTLIFFYCFAYLSLRYFALSPH